MTALRQQAFELLETMPEEVLENVIQILKAEKLRQVEKEKRLEKKRIAFEELKSLCRPVLNLDEEKAKAEYFKEKYGL